MDRLNKSMEATHIDDCDGATAAACDMSSSGALDMNAIDLDVLMEVAQRKSDANCDSESDEETEDNVDTVCEDKKTEEKNNEDNVMKAERERKRGRRAYKKKDYEKAATHFQKAIDLNSKEIAYHFRLAQVMCELKKYEECIYICSGAIKVGKDNKGSVKQVAASMVLRGRAMKEQGKMDKARADVEKANKFLTSIALVKIEKGKYYEAFDFIYEAFECDRIFFTQKGELSEKEIESDKIRRLNYVFKVVVGYLDEALEYSSYGERSEDDVKGHQEFIENKRRGDEAFRKNDHKLANSMYGKICFSYPTAVLDFLLSHSKEAEKNKKWGLCNDICVSLTCHILSVLSNLGGYHASNNKKLKEELKKKLTEARALKAKALRRMQKFTEIYDNMFYEKLETFHYKIPRQQLAEFHVRRADDVINPDKKPFSGCKMLMEMADFSGKGKVTAKEFILFYMCYKASMGRVVPTDSPGMARILLQKT